MLRSAAGPHVLACLVRCIGVCNECCWMSGVAELLCARLATFDLRVQCSGHCTANLTPVHFRKGSRHAVDENQTALHV
jgi:hypothetical protein